MPAEPHRLPNSSFAPRRIREAIVCVGHCLLSLASDSVFILSFGDCYDSPLWSNIRHPWLLLKSLSVEVEFAIPCCCSRPYWPKHPLFSNVFFVHFGRCPVYRSLNKSSNLGRPLPFSSSSLSSNFVIAYSPTWSFPLVQLV